MRSQNFLKSRSEAFKELANQTTAFAKRLPWEDDFHPVRVACNRFAYECLAAKQQTDQANYGTNEVETGLRLVTSRP